MLSQTEFEIPQPRAVKIIGAFDPARPSSEKWTEWLGDKYDAEKDRVLITDHPETRAGHMFSKLYNLPTSGPDNYLDKILPTWTYGKWSNYNLTIVDDVYNDTDHIRPPANGPVPNTQGVYFAHPKNPNTDEREEVQIFMPNWNDRYVNSDNYPLSTKNCEQIDIDLRRFWPCGRPYTDGVTFDQIGPGGWAGWYPKDCNDSLDTLIQGLGDYSAILAGADPTDVSSWRAGYTSDNPNTIFNVTDIFNIRPRALNFYSLVGGPFPYSNPYPAHPWAWDEYLEWKQWWPVMMPAPNKGNPGAGGGCYRFMYERGYSNFGYAVYHNREIEELHTDGLCATTCEGTPHETASCINPNAGCPETDACPPSLFEWNPEAYIWTGGGPDLKIYEWDWTEKTIGESLYGDFRDRWLYDASEQSPRFAGAADHWSKYYWCTSTDFGGYGPPSDCCSGEWGWCNDRFVSCPGYYPCWGGQWMQYRWKSPCWWSYFYPGDHCVTGSNWTTPITFGSVTRAGGLSDELWYANQLPFNEFYGYLDDTSLYAMTDSSYALGNICAQGPDLGGVGSCPSPCSALPAVPTLTQPRGEMDELWKEGETYWVGGYWTENYGWPLHMVNSVNWDAFEAHGSLGSSLGPIAGGIMNDEHMEGPPIRCNCWNGSQTYCEICHTIHEFPPIIEHPAWSHTLKNTAPYNRYLDYQTKITELDTYKQESFNFYLVCETLGENKLTVIVKKPDRLIVFNDWSERVCPEYMEGDLLYVQWDAEELHPDENTFGMYVDMNVDKRKLFDYSNVEGIKKYLDIFPEPYIPMETTFLIPSGGLVDSNFSSNVGFPSEDAYSYNCYPPSLMHMDRQESVVECESPCTREPRSYPPAAGSAAGAAGAQGDAGEKPQGSKGESGGQGATGGGGNKGNEGQKGEKGVAPAGEVGSKGNEGSKGDASTIGSKFSGGTTEEAINWGPRIDGTEADDGINQKAVGNVESPLGSTANLTAGEPPETDTLYSIIFTPKKLGICVEDRDGLTYAAYDASPDDYHPKYLYFTTFVSDEIIDY